MSHYQRLVRAFVLFTLAMVVSSTAISGVWYRRITLRTIVTETRDQLSSVRDLVEQAMLGSYELLVLDLLRVTLYPQFDAPLNAVLFRGEQSPSTIRRISGDLLIANISRPEVANLTAIFLDRNFVIDSRSYFSTIARSPDAAITANLRAVPMRIWFRRWALDANYQPVEVLTYVTSMPYFSPEEQIRGYFYVDVELSAVAERLRELGSNRDSDIVVLTPDHRVLVATNGTGEAAVDYASRLRRNHRGYLVDGDTVAASLTSGGPKGFTYVSIVDSPTFFRQTRVLVVVLLLTALATVVIGGALAILLAKRFYDPVQELMKTFEELGAETFEIPFRDEFHVMDQTVRALSGRLEIASERLEHRELFELLTLGRPPDADVIEEHDLPLAHVLVFVVRDRAHRHWASSLRTLDLPGANKLVFTVNEREIVVLVRPDPDAPGSVRDTLTTESLEARFGSVGLPGGVAGPAGDAPDLRHEYGLARRAARQASLAGSPRILTQAEMEHLRDLPPVDTQAMLSELLAGRSERVLNRLDEIGRTVDSGEIAATSVVMQISRVAFVMSEVVFQRGVTDLMPSFLAEIQNLFDDGDVLGALSWLRRSVLSFDELSTDTTTPYGKAARRVCDYIEEHLCEPLSLDQLARIVSLSPSYVSRLFKDEIGETFIEYVGRRRLEVAAGLLRNDPAIVLKDVAAQVGYSNVQYFITRFRRRYGVSPARYRTSAARR